MQEKRKDKGTHSMQEAPSGKHGGPTLPPSLSRTTQSTTKTLQWQWRVSPHPQPQPCCSRHQNCFHHHHHLPHSLPRSRPRKCTLNSADTRVCNPSLPCETQTQNPTELPISPNAHTTSWDYDAHSNKMKDAGKLFQARYVENSEFADWECQESSASCKFRPSGDVSKPNPTNRGLASETHKGAR